jgi:hypothetical protein
MSSEGFCEGKRVIDNHKMATLSDNKKQKFGHIYLDLEDKFCYFEFTNQCKLFLSEGTIPCMLRTDHIILKTQIG